MLPKGAELAVLHFSSWMNNEMNGAAEMQTSSALLLLLLTMSDPLPFLEIRAELHILEFQLLPWASWEAYWAACANGSLQESRHRQQSSSSRLPFPLVHLASFQIKELSTGSKRLLHHDKNTSVSLEMRHKKTLLILLPMLSVTVMIFRDMVESVMLLNEDDCKIQQKILKVLNGSE